MNDMTGKIKPSQFIILIIAFINGSILLLSLVDSTMDQDSWIIIISGYVVSIPFLLSYVQLAKKFPGKNLMEINDIIYGKILGKIISIGYTVLLLLILSGNFRQIVEFYNGYILTETPPIILYIMIALLCSYAVKKGISAIAKTSLYVVVFSVITAVVTSVLMIENMDFSNILPMFEAPERDFAQTTYIMACIPYCEVFCFLMVTPYVDSTKKLGKYMLGGVGAAMLVFLIMVIRNTVTLGASSGIFAEDSYQSVRLINIGEFLTRMELFVALTITALMFIKIAVLQFATVSSISYLLKLKTYVPLLLPLAAIAIVNALIAYDSTIENTNNANYHVIYTFPFEFLLPPLTLLIAKIRKLKPISGIVRP